MNLDLNGIVAFSLHFCSGTAIAEALHPDSKFLYISAGACCIVCVLLCLWPRGKDTLLWRERAAVTLLGAFCSFSWGILGTDGGGNLFPGLTAKIAEIVREGFGTRCGILLPALILGDRSMLGRDLTEAFRASGASHILALSGMHLGIICGLLNILLLPLGNSPAGSRARSLCVTIGCIIYTLAAGATPSLVRAMLFVAIGEFARQCPERMRSPEGICAGAMCLQLAFRPDMISSVGFQLSYLAVCGIIVIYPRLKALFPVSIRYKGLMSRLWNAASLSISCQIATAPLVFFKFGSLPTHFLLTNIISLPLTTVLVSCGVISIGLEALGSCPEIMKSLCEKLAEALIYCMEIISEM